MAKTSFATTDPEVKMHWDEELFREVREDTYFARFTGTSRTNMVYSKEDLTKKKGDRIRFGFIKQLRGPGVEDGATLENNEERLNDYTKDIVLKRYRHGVRDDGDLDRQRPFFDIDEEADMLIREWGKDKIDSLHFDAHNTTPTHILYPSGAGATFAFTTTEATALAALHATGSKLTPNFITAARTFAETGGATSTTMDSRRIEPIKPLKVDGEEYYVLLVHPDVNFDLETNSTMQQAQRDAQARSKDNPIFKNAVLVWGGVIVHRHVKVGVGTSGGVPYAKCRLYGQGAQCLAWGRRPKVVYKTFDYDEEHGWAWAVTMKAQMTQFNSKDFGSIGVYLSRTQVSSVAAS